MMIKHYITEGERLLLQRLVETYAREILEAKKVVSEGDFTDLILYTLDIEVHSEES